MTTPVVPLQPMPGRRRRIFPRVDVTDRDMTGLLTRRPELRVFPSIGVVVWHATRENA